MVDPRWVDEQLSAKGDDLSKLNAENIKLLERIEFLEKVLEQAIIVIPSNKPLGELRELAKYLEEKNG